MYYVVDESKLSSEAGYSVYTAGTATSVPWSGVTEKPSSYPPASHNHDERYYTETEMNSKLAEKATKVHTHTKSEVGLGNVDNTADATKSVKYATSAGSASSAAALTSNAGSSTQPVYFSGGKPVACSYTLGKSVPADALFTDHTYGNMKGATSSSAGSAGLVPAPNIGEQLKFLRADGAWVIPTNTTYSVGTSSYLGITKLYTETGSATDGTMTQNAITSALNGKSPTSHTHNYAGSSSSGGAANSANKLATARTVSGGTDITLSFNYDGSGNSSANIGFYSSSASVGDKNNYPFHRFAKLDTIAASYSDKSTTFFISQDYSGGGFGIVRIVLRTNNSSLASTVEVKWLVRCGLSADSVQVGIYNVFGKTYADALGNDMNRNIVATISIFNSDKSLNTIKDMITDENRTGFKIIYGNTQKDYTGMKIESISEEISNERSVINISLATDKTIAPTETTETTTEKTKEETKEKTETASDK